MSFRVVVTAPLSECCKTSRASYSGLVLRLRLQSAVSLAHQTNDFSGSNFVGKSFSSRIERPDCGAPASVNNILVDRVRSGLVLKANI